MAYFHRFSNFVWTVEKDSNALRCTCGHVHFRKRRKKIVVFKNIRMLVGRSLKHLVWLGTRPKFGFRRAADGSNPSRLTLFRTKKNP